MFDDLFKAPGEKEISASLKRLVVPAPKIVFATGNMERSIDKNGDKNYKTGFNEITFDVVIPTQKIQIDLFENMKVDSIFILNKPIKYLALDSIHLPAKTVRKPVVACFGGPCWHFSFTVCPA